jgi:hypothetical protein
LPPKINIMLQKLTSPKPQDSGTTSPLPQRRWAIRAPRAYLLGIIGAVVAAIPPFLLWWFFEIPLIFTIPAMIAGWYVLLPPPLYLALDNRGIALIVPSWNRQSFLWIPRDRIIRVQIQQGWLIGEGVSIQKQNDLDWRDAAERAGADVPGWLERRASLGEGVNQLFAAPIELLDSIARDEIEMWLYQQGK